MIEKRDGTLEEFNLEKIKNAIQKAFKATNIKDNTENVVLYFVNHFKDLKTVEEIQDAVEKSLMAKRYFEVAKNFILYRKQRENIRNSKSHLTKVFNEMLDMDAKDLDLMRENANIDGNAPMGLMLLFGSETSKEYTKRYILDQKHAELHENADFHIHDLNMYPCTFNCCHIDLKDLFKRGFSTGHGTIREPQSIQSASSLAAIVVQSNQNDMFGGQSLPMFEYNLAPYVAKSFCKRLKECIEICLGAGKITDNTFEDFINLKYNEYGSVLDNLDEVKSFIHSLVGDKTDYIVNKAFELTEKDVYQSMEAFIHNMNTLNSRAGSQTPFSSINYGTGTSTECRMIIKNLLLATEKGLGKHETPIFPIQIFKIKEGVNANPEDKNYDLFKLACRVTSKRLYPNYVNIDVPFNLQYYIKGKPETEMATMGCRTRVIGQLDGTGCVANRGNIAFNTINLPRLAIKANKDIQKFFESFDVIINNSISELLKRVKFLCKKKVYNFPFLMGQKIYKGSENLEWNDSIEPALRNGTLSVGFVGLAECLIALTGKHHGESKESLELGLQIIQHLRDRMDETTEKTGWNFSCFATPAESTAGRFVKADKKKFGIIKGVTERAYYTNSFHVPVYYPITAHEKMEIEGKFHSICNAGAISYVELDGDPSQNVSVVEKLVQYSRKCGISYFSLNFELDTCPVCGFQGFINSNVCPNCGWIEGTDPNND